MEMKKDESPEYRAPSPVTAEDRKRNRIDVWDLLEIVNCPCPARVLTNQEWNTLVALATACLTKNPSQRPRAFTLCSGQGVVVIWRCGCENG